MVDASRISVHGIHLQKIGGSIFVHHCQNRTGLLKMIADAYAFEFGSSRGSKEKDSVMSSIVAMNGQREVQGLPWRQ